MRKILYSLIFILCCSTVKSQWIANFQTPYPQIVKALSSPNDSVCWFISNMDTLFKTSDAGQTWTSLPPSATSFNPYGLFVLSSDTAFKSSNSNLYKTVDGGLTWSVSFIGVASNPPKMYMKNSQVGILTSNSLLYKTTNGGNIWSFATITQPPFPIVNTPGKGALCVTGDTIWVACVGHGAAYSPDFGVTWIMPANNGLTFNTYGNISFSNTQMGIAIMHNSDTVYVTTDGAANWSAGINTNGANQDVLAVDSGLWFIPSPADNFYIKYSGDSGTTWTQQLFDQSGFEQLEKSRNGITLWAGTDKGRVYTNTVQLANDVGSNRSQELSINISPNPFANVAMISTDRYINGTVIVSTITGKVVKKINFSGNNCYINREEISSGIYLVKITDENGINLNRKIVIQ
jgi:photosystem II stability/assembly factor-like uncharacterized protein